MKLRDLTIVLAATAALTGACGDSGSPSKNNGNGDGANNGSTDGNNNGSSDGGSNNGSAAMSWAGTWSVELAYDVSCDVGFGNIKHATIDQTDSVEITGDNGSLTLTLDNFEMTGIGHDDSLTLSGDYPVHDEQDHPAGIDTPESPNNVTIKLTTVSDANDAAGSVSGSFTSRFGNDCTIDDGGQATFTR